MGLTFSRYLYQERLREADPITIHSRRSSDAPRRIRQWRGTGPNGDGRIDGTASNGTGSGRAHHVGNNSGRAANYVHDPLAAGSSGNNNNNDNGSSSVPATPHTPHTKIQSVNKLEIEIKGDDLNGVDLEAIASDYVDRLEVKKQQDRARRLMLQIKTDSEPAAGPKVVAVPISEAKSARTEEQAQADDEYYNEQEKRFLQKPRPEPKRLQQIVQKINWKKGELLGFGAYGQVFLGLNEDSGQLLAVKQVPLVRERTKANLNAIAALEQEISMMQNLVHPNIVQYWGVERTESSLDILLEFVPGGSIASLLKRFGRFNETLVRVYTKQILSGLEYLHSHQIVHRDIKGANILVDNLGICKLADFGAATRLADLSVDGPRSLHGTPYWMAPEVVTQVGHGRQADIWSVGCTVIEMITGKPPWSQQYTSHVSAMFHIANTTQPPALPDTISGDARDFILQCLQREPRNRPNATRLLVHPFVTQALTMHSQGVAGPLNSFDASMTASGLNFAVPMALLAAGAPMPAHLAPPAGPLPHVMEGGSASAAAQSANMNNNNMNVNPNNGTSTNTNGIGNGNGTNNGTINGNGDRIYMPGSMTSAGGTSGSGLPPPHTGTRLRSTTGSGGGQSIGNSLAVTGNGTTNGGNSSAPMSYNTQSLQPGMGVSQYGSSLYNSGIGTSTMTPTAPGGGGNSGNSMMSNGGYGHGASSSGQNTIHAVAVIPATISPTPSTYHNQPSPSAFALLPDPTLAPNHMAIPPPASPSSSSTFIHTGTTPPNGNGLIAPSSNASYQPGQSSPTSLHPNPHGNGIGNGMNSAVAIVSGRQTSPRPQPQQFAGGPSPSAASMAAAAIVARTDSNASSNGLPVGQPSPSPPSPNAPIGGGNGNGLIIAAGDRYSPHASPTDDTKQRTPLSAKGRPQLLVQASQGGSALRLSPSGYARPSPHRASGSGAIRANPRTAAEADYLFGAAVSAQQQQQLGLGSSKHAVTSIRKDSRDPDTIADANMILRELNHELDQQLNTTRDDEFARALRSTLATRNQLTSSIMFAMPTDGGNSYAYGPGASSSYHAHPHYHPYSAAAAAIASSSLAAGGYSPNHNHNNGNNNNGSPANGHHHHRGSGTRPYRVDDVPVMSSAALREQEDAVLEAAYAIERKRQLQADWEREQNAERAYQASMAAAQGLPPPTMGNNMQHSGEFVSPFSVPNGAMGDVPSPSAAGAVVPGTGSGRSRNNTNRSARRELPTPKNKVHVQWAKTVTRTSAAV